MGSISIFDSRVSIHQRKLERNFGKKNFQINKLTQFIDYFVEERMENPNKPIQMWNVSGQRHRSNNPVERWNSTLNTLVGGNS